MRRTLAVLAVAALVIGGGAAAYAVTVGGDAPGARAQAKSCVTKARTDHPGDPAATRAAVADCLSVAGITRLGVGPVPKAIRQQIKALPADKKAALVECVKQAHTANPSDRTAFRDAAKACLSQAGITIPPPPPEALARRQKAKDCLAQARKDQPGATRAQLRDAVKQCVKAPA
ncbi:MAG TPA: hypothetical protein VHS52_01225 [Acidimicrobiales bacterium]|nr:hypothetical protein [Acidimicrobiales bacterium]